MTIQQLRYFLALCEDLNYTHTAGRMYLSRQALRLSMEDFWTLTDKNILLLGSR